MLLVLSSFVRSRNARRRLPGFGGLGASVLFLILQLGFPAIAWTATETPAPSDDAFWIVGVGLIISLSAIVLVKRPRRAAAPVEAH